MTFSELVHHEDGQATQTDPPTPVADDGSRRGVAWWQWMLTGLGGAFVLTQASVWIRWLATGPVQLQALRDVTHFSWQLAWFYQVVAWVVFVLVLRAVVRQCRDAGRLTFDAKFMVAGAATYWLDPLANFLIPVYTYSQQWINLGDWMGQMPGVRYPDAGRVPEPVLFLAPVYAAGWLLFAMFITKMMEFLRARLRRPTTLKVFGGAIAMALAVDIAFELPMFASGLWSNQGAPRIGFFASSGKLYPITEMLIATTFFATLSAIRYYKNDKGETILERGLDGASQRRRSVMSTLAFIAVMNTMWLVGAVAWTAGGLFSGPWKEAPAFVNVGVCDDVDGGMRSTRYGPCPGSPEFRIPMPGSLEGEKPNGRGEYLNGSTQCETCEPIEYKGSTNDHEVTSSG